MAESPARLLKEFHSRPGCDITIPEKASIDVPGLLARIEYLKEELKELEDAYYTDDLVAYADALGDLTYLLYGTAERTGIDLDAVVEEIHHSNMTKTPSPGDGKAIKGPGYQKPNLLPILKRSVSNIDIDMYEDFRDTQWKD